MARRERNRIHGNHAAAGKAAGKVEGKVVAESAVDKAAADNKEMMSSTQSRRRKTDLSFTPQESAQMECLRRSTHAMAKALRHQLIGVDFLPQLRVLLSPCITFHLAAKKVLTNMRTSSSGEFQSTQSRSTKISMMSARGESTLSIGVRNMRRLVRKGLARSLT